jgi:hypothetical protein
MHAGNKRVFVLMRDCCLCVQCVVIGLQSTGEARTMELVEQEGTDLNDFVSTAKYVHLLPAP